MSSKSKSFDFSLVVLRSAILILTFLVGGVFAVKDWQPIKFFIEGHNATQTLFKEMTQTRSDTLEEIVYKGDGVIKHDSQQAYQGLTVLQGIFPGGTQLRLIDMDGKLLHTWPVNFFNIWPNPTHISKRRIPKTPFHYHTQGNVVLPNGSIIVNMGYLGTAKLDKQAKVLWTLDRSTHHIITPTHDGNYWIAANRNIDDIAEELLFFDIKKSWLKETTEERYENTMLLVSPNGKILKEFSVLQALYNAGGYESQIYDAFTILKSDLTHINDIEEVTQALADKIKGVNKNDLLVSIRQMHMLAILDKDSGAIKWTQIGPWIRQHDPDITPEGNIIVFNNSLKNFGFNGVKGSSLIELDPASGQAHVVYPRDSQPSFFTEIMGTHQTLANGNILITESKAGRVFEINKQGDIVWEFVSPYDNTHSSLVEVAHRYPLDYFTVKDWSSGTPTLVKE